MILNYEIIAKIFFFKEMATRKFTGQPYIYEKKWNLFMY